MKAMIDEDVDKLVTVGNPPYQMSKIEGDILGYIQEDKAKIQIAQRGDKVIGFMIYHHIFDCILIVRGIYLVSKYRGKGWLFKSLIFSVGYVSRVFSQTYSKRGPKEIQGEKRARRRIYSGKDFHVWENLISDGHKGNKKWEVDAHQQEDTEPPIQKMEYAPK